MKRKLWLSLALVLVITTLWCNSVFAVSVVIDGYTATGTSTISNGSRPYGAGGTSYAGTNCAVIADTDLKYSMYIYDVGLGIYIPYHNLHQKAHASHDGGYVVAIAYTPSPITGTFYVADYDSTTHKVIHNGVTTAFASHS